MAVEPEVDLFVEANLLLRTSYQIAARQGKDTNWEAFLKQLEKHLDRAHKAMYPKPTDEPAGPGEVQVGDG